MELLLNGPPKLGVEGPAGTGKSMVLLLKIIYLVKEETQFNVILLAPDPHHLQCKNFLEENGIETRLSDVFPLSVGRNHRHGRSYRHQFVPVLHEVMYRHQTLSHAHVTS